MLLKANTTVYAIVTDHPRYPKSYREGDDGYGVFADRAAAERVCAAWNDYYARSHTPQPWPFYVSECVVQAGVNLNIDYDDDAWQPGLFNNELADEPL